MTRRALVASLASSALVGLVVLGACLVSGCGSIGYYAQSVRGHLALVGSARPVADWIADPDTPPALKARLALSQHIRDFAVAELMEPDNQSYRRYADLGRPAAVWNVVAAPELALALRTWCFVVVGCVGYRGYYSRPDADAMAATLRADGLDVSVYGVAAYSTLGALPGERFADPLLSTFIEYPEGELARLIFHELAHQVAYARGDTEFNESFATAVERIGGERWLRDESGPDARAAYARLEARRADFRTLTGSYRERLEILYRSAASDTDKRAGKEAVYAALRSDYADLKRERWGGFSGYDAWFAGANNASFGVLAAYTGLVPAFMRLFEREGRDFGRFYAEVRRLAELDDKDARRAALER